ncbi:class I SAM-dependent DNA methyltransferase [Vaginisenegalia massiliensis]|uniref:class I SAM-dependent DNA methyltransferase n=1 Tax=Vaginisenegalia massiliensis TaxID=2058294 RepID=UPI000F524E23|nr:class I SAM-dependent methyltransferase [Vaginisenegalia massiliensis]
MSFGSIAEVYNRFTDQEAYDDWLDFTLSCLNQAPEKMLDLACGTGVFARLMAPFAKQVWAVDLDPLMIAQAQKQDNDANLHFAQGNMLTLSSDYKGMDLVTCYADSLCFLPDFEAVQQAFLQVATCLNEEGLFLFDVWSPMGLLAFDDYVYIEEDEEIYLLWRSSVDRQKYEVDHHLTIFSPVSESNDYQKQETHLVESTYGLTQYQQALAQAGFNQIQICADFGSQVLDEQSAESVKRWFFICQKG